MRSTVLNPHIGIFIAIFIVSWLGARLSTGPAAGPLMFSAEVISQTCSFITPLCELIPGGVLYVHVHVFKYLIIALFTVFLKPN